MDKLNIYGDEKQYARELERIKELDISEENKATILRFHAYLRANSNSDRRICKLSWQLRKIAKILDIPFENAGKPDIERVLSAINTAHLEVPGKEDRLFAVSTKADYGRALKQLYKWLRGTKTAPPEVDWIKTRVPMRDSSFSNELFNWEDVRKLTLAANNPRDVALINFLYESGARIGEVLNLKMSDVIFKERYARVRLFGKTGERWIVLVTCVPYLAQYLNTHPHRTEPSSYFWLSTSDKNKNAPLRYAGATMSIRRLFKSAKITKRCNPHKFRHSRATELAKQLPEPQLRMFFGWERGSDTPSIYTHLSGRDIDNAILSLNGLADENKGVTEIPIKCSVCSQVNNPGSQFCSHCGYGMSVKAVLDSEQKVMSEIEKTMSYFMELSKDPAKLAKFQEFCKKPH